MAYCNPIWHRSAKEGCTLSARRKEIVDRSIEIPFGRGRVHLGLNLTGPIAVDAEADKIVDMIFGKAIALINSDVIPAINAVENQIRISVGNTRADTMIELEVLGNSVELAVTSDLKIGINPDLLRTWVAKMVAADFAKFAIVVIVGFSLDGIVNSSVVDLKEEHRPPPPIIGLLIAEQDDPDPD